MSAIKFALQQRQKSLRKNTSEKMSTELSPDSKCPICLDRFNNISYLDTCLHKFCFRCIHEWSKNKAECPLCKQPFNSIYHSIKSEQDFQTYDLRPVDNGSFGTFGGVRFRYRTTLTGVHRLLQRRTSPLPDNGVLFEAAVNAPQHAQYRYIKHMMMRLAASRRAAREGMTLHTVREQEMINFRRELYRKGLKVTTVMDGGRSRDTSAEFYQRNPACLHRLVPWLKRELIVLYGAHGSLVNIVQHIIMSRITRSDMEDVSFRDELRPFLQGRTDHFLHEFINFAKCPYNMEAYDQNAVYNCPAPFSNEDSSNSSSVITISEDEQNSVDLDPRGDARSNLSSSVWDDETPGPSYFTAAEQRTENLTVPDSDSDISFEEDTAESGASPQQSRPHDYTEATHGKVDSDECSDSDDCFIVGFLKARAERTPELVQLSSDSDESVTEDPKEVPSVPQHIRFISPSPQHSQSSDTADGSRSQNVMLEDNQLSSEERCRSSTSRKHKMSGKSERKTRDHHGTEGRFDHYNGHRERRWSKKRDHRKSRSRSRERRSAVISPGGGSNFFSRSRSRERRSAVVSPGGGSNFFSRSRSRERRSAVISPGGGSNFFSRSRSREHRSAVISPGGGSNFFSRSRSRERRSAVVSPSRGSHFFIDRGSYSITQDASYSKRSSSYSKRKDDDFSHSGYRYHRSFQSCSVQSYSFHSQDRARDDGRTHHKNRRSCHKYSDRHFYSRSRSRSRESRWQDRRRSRSGTYSSSRSPSARRSHHGKPGGKRKYKARHLEDLAHDRRSTSYSDCDPSTPVTKHKKKSKSKSHKKCKERSRRRSKGPATEDFTDESFSERSKRRHKKKKKHKKSKKHRSNDCPERSSAAVITIDSDSDDFKDIVSSTHKEEPVDGTPPSSY